ncbi:MAG TPA: hypothetical protein VNZ22_01150 [Bacillota bacterium]|nr:hypothetical protein [Bacillota bacterium]
MSTTSFDPSTQTVSVHGSFNSWGTLPLTNNPAGPNPALWSGTADVAANGTIIEYKYVIGAGTWESIPKGNNRLATLPTTSGASLVLPTAFFADLGPSISVDLAFQVDMAQEINIGTFTPGISMVYPKGTFNSWGTVDSMTNDPTILRTNQYGLVTSNVYVGTYTITASPGQTMDYKFYIDTGNRYEDLPAGSGDPSDHNNRFLNIANTPTQALPLVFFNNAPYAPTATNFVTFQVDMSAQVLNGSFDPAFSTVEVRGGFNGWGTPQIVCTNDPTALNTNLYKAVVRIVDSVGAAEQYKFWATISANGGWETLADNRGFKLTSGTTQILPAVYFNNLSPNDLLPEDTLVTFSVNMANAVGTDGHAFDPAAGDQVYLNGVPNGFVNWDVFLPQLINTPAGSQIYSIDMLLPKGSPVVQTYKYSINGTDNEAGQGSNHSRVVRRTGTYVLPQDTFRTQYSEPDFGALAVGPAAAGKVPVSWLGRPGVHLQTAADLSSGLWQDILGTDGARWTNGQASTNGFLSVTNYPTSADKTFFRLVKP